MLAFNNRFWFLLAGFLCLAVGGFAAHCDAGALTATNEAFDNTLGPSAGVWKGTAAFTGGLGLDADVEFAVFAPGTFDDFLSEQGIAFVDPTGPTDFTYAYQVFYNAGLMSINSNTVGLDGDEAVGLVSYIPKALVAGADIDPSNAALQGVTSAAWDYVDGSTATFNGPPKESTILFFTSPYIPDYDTAALLHLGAPAPQLVASPSNISPPGGDIPEPATLALLLLGAVSLLGAARRR